MQLPRQSSGGNTLPPRCQAPMPVQAGSSEHTCGRCTQVEKILCLVTELREEVSRLRSIRESEREMDYWNHTLHSLRQAQWVGSMHDTKDSLSSLHLDENGDSGDRGQQ